MQLQIHISDIIRHIKKPTQIGVQYNNPIVDALRRDLCVPDNVSIEAYSNQATIHFKQGQITVNYNATYGAVAISFLDIDMCRTMVQTDLKLVNEYLSFDLCPKQCVAYKNIITKAKLKDYYKYCED